MLFVLFWLVVLFFGFIYLFIYYLFLFSATKLGLRLGCLTEGEEGELKIYS
jgi:hypothetical protein